MAGQKFDFELFVAVLIVAASRHQAWAFAEPEQAGEIWKALGAAATLYLLALVYEAYSFAWPALAYWAWEETQVLVCSTAYLRWPWPVREGQAVCSAWVGVDFGVISAAVVALVLLFAPRKVL